MRKTYTTVMLVCEGYAEVQLANVIRELYLPRGCGIRLQKANARGFGGAQALKLAEQYHSEGAYDRVAVLTDTDQHWGGTERLRAQALGIAAIENAPCLEATLLRVDGQAAAATTEQNKQRFLDRYGAPAHREYLIQRNFPRQKFDQARSQIASINELLRLIGC